MPPPCLRVDFLSVASVHLVIMGRPEEEGVAMIIACLYFKILTNFSPLKLFSSLLPSYRAGAVGIDVFVENFA